MMFTILNIWKLWLALRRIVSTKSPVLQKISRWISYVCSLLRLTWRIRYRATHRKERPKRAEPPPSCLTDKDVCKRDAGPNDINMNLTTTVFHDNCSASQDEQETVSLSDPTIAFSQHPYTFSFTESPTSETSPHRRNPTRAFSRSDPTLPTQPLEDTLAIPGLRRGFDHSVSHFPFSDNLSVNADTIDALTIPRTASPSTHSVVFPLPPIEGPAGEPMELTVGLGERLDKFLPLIPCEHKRYERNVFVAETPSKSLDLEPLQMSFRKLDPYGWTSYLHPEGVLYFCDTEKRVYTDMNLYDENILALIQGSIEEIYQFLDVNSVVLSPTADLVLDMVDGKVYYYFADHRRRSVFYLDKISTSDFSSWGEVQGASELSHFAHLLEAEYWWHVFLFPSSLTIREDIVNELRDIIIHGLGDGMTSAVSTITYSNEDLYKLLTVANSLKENIGTSYGGSICMLSRFMWGFAHGRFLHWHGQPAARLSRNMSAHGPIRKVRSKMMKIASMLLFSAPDVHLRNLEKIWVDRLMYEHVWKNATWKLIDEWKEFTLFSTVLLNANVAFLAIQTIDQNDHPYRSPGQVSSYLSIIASMGSIILSLLLVRVHRTKEKESAHEAWEFLSARAHPKYGPEVLAIVYSLPYALLMWGVIGFLVAVAWMCLDDSDASTRALTGLASLSIAFMAGLCIWMGWEPRPDNEAEGASGSHSFDVFRNNLPSVRLTLPMTFSIPWFGASRRLNETVPIELEANV